MSCPLCHSGNHESNGHINSFKHRKALIKLFKKYNDSIKDKDPNEYDKIYESILFTYTTILK